MSGITEIPHALLDGADAHFSSSFAQRLRALDGVGQRRARDLPESLCSDFGERMEPFMNLIIRTGPFVVGRGGEGKRGDILSEMADSGTGAIGIQPREATAGRRFRPAVSCLFPKIGDKVYLDYESFGGECSGSDTCSRCEFRSSLLEPFFQ